MEYEREVIINGIAVDFMVKGKIIEVFGSTHYTVDERIKGYDIVRALILQQWKDVRLIHAGDLNNMKGVGNRINFINLIVSDGDMPNKINWDRMF